MAVGPFTTPVDVSVPFDGTEDSGGTAVVPVFVSDNVRDGILEARDTAQGNSRFVMTLTYNGNIGDNTFIGYLNTIPGDSSPVILPIKCEITEFTFTNKQSTADYTLEFRINSTTGATFYSVSKVNTQFFADSSITNQTFNPGDQIYVKYIDDGTNAQDVAISLYFDKVL